MEAKDTVMSDRKIRKAIHSINTEVANQIMRDSAYDKVFPEDRVIAKTQAEISFKAGFKYALEGAVMEGAYDSIKKLGIKEVVEWGESECFEHPYDSDQLGEEYNRKRHRCPECWRAKLKEWGI